MGSVLRLVCCVGVCDFDVVIIVICMASTCGFVLVMSVGKLRG